MIEIREVKSAKEIRRFIQFPLNLYKKCPYFVPPLYVDEKKMFKKNFVYNDQCEAVYFNAYKDGKIAGRISGILQLAANKKWNQKRVRFTRFDSIDDQSVANALFAAVENWAKQKGMDEVAGPLGFSDLEREGLLIEGFDELATFEEQYNYPYYQKLIENLGYEKEVDWVERQLRAPAVVDERIARLNAMMMKKYKLHLGTAKNGAEFCKKYGDRFFALLDETYADLYGTFHRRYEKNDDRKFQAGYRHAFRFGNSRRKRQRSVLRACYSVAGKSSSALRRQTDARCAYKNTESRASPENNRSRACRSKTRICGKGSSHNFYCRCHGYAEKSRH